MPQKGDTCIDLQWKRSSSPKLLLRALVQQSNSRGKEWYLKSWEWKQKVDTYTSRTGSLQNEGRCQSSYVNKNRTNQREWQDSSDQRRWTSNEPTLKVWTHHVSYTQDSLQMAKVRYQVKIRSLRRREGHKTPRTKSQKRRNPYCEAARMTPYRFSSTNQMCNSIHTIQIFIGGKRQLLSICVHHTGSQQRWDCRQSHRNDPCFGIGHDSPSLTNSGKLGMWILK